MSRIMLVLLYLFAFVPIHIVTFAQQTTPQQVRNLLITGVLDEDTNTRPTDPVSGLFSGPETDGVYGSIEYAMSDVKNYFGGDVILTIEANTTVLSGPDDVFNPYNVQVVGKTGSAIEGGYTLEGNSVTFSNITFQNDTNDRGVVIRPGTEATFENCLFIGQSDPTKSRQHGQHITVQSVFNSVDRSTLNVSNCIFKNHRSGIFIEGVDADAMIVSSTFTGNFISIVDSRLGGNALYESLSFNGIGGSMQLETGAASNTTIQSCTSSKNETLSAFDLFQASNISLYNVTVDGAVNAGVNLSGASNISIQDSTLSLCGDNLNSSQPLIDESAGIAMSGVEDVTVANCHSVSNIGAGLSLTGGSNVKVLSSTFDKNTNSGVTVLSANGFTMKGGSLSGNDTLLDNLQGGGMYLAFSENVSIDSVTFTENLSTTSFPGAPPQFGPKGGGLYILDSEATVSHSVFKQNKTSGSGGGIYVQSNRSVSFGDLTVAENTAELHGGGIHVTSPDFDSSGAFLLLSSEIRNNTAKQNGGGLSVLDLGDSSLKLDSNRFLNNTSGQMGGGFYIGGTPTNDVYVWNTECNGNASQGNGGGAAFLNITNLQIGVDATHQTPTAQPNTFETNTSKINGGGIYVESCNDVLIEAGNKFRKNRAGDMGSPTDSFQASDGNGGGIYIVDSLKVNLGNNTIGDDRYIPNVIRNPEQGNIAVNNGGGMFIESSQVSFTGARTGLGGTDFIGNQALNGNGGGIAIRNVRKENDQFVAFNAARIQENRAPVAIPAGMDACDSLNGNGGGVAIYLSDAITFKSRLMYSIGSTETEFNANLGNVASANGGGLYMRESSADVIHIGIIGNRSDFGCGGGIAIVGSKPSLIDACLIQGNIAFADREDGQSRTDSRDGNGGGIACLQGILPGEELPPPLPTLIQDCVIGYRYHSDLQSELSNIARNNGGGIYVENVAVEIRQSPKRVDTNLQDIIDAAAIYRNTANGSGGGIAIRGSVSDINIPLTIANLRIAANEAMEESGGGMALLDEANQVYIESADIDNNKAKQNGGGIYIRKSNPFFGQLDGTPFFDLRGGKTWIHNNQAQDGFGGGIAYEGDSKKALRNGRLRGIVVYSNTAVSKSGGGIAFLNNAHNVDLEYSLIGLDPNTGQAAGNTAPNGAGGGIYCDNSSPRIGGTLSVPLSMLSVSGNNYIKYNSAFSGGGIAASNGSAVRVGGNWIANNVAAISGGGIACDNASPQIGSPNPPPFPVSDFLGRKENLGGNFIENNTARLGGGVALLDSSEAKVRWNMIMNNALQGGDAFGGGIYVQGAASKPHITNNDILLNQGDGVYVNEESIPILQNNIIDSNTRFGIHAPSLEVLAKGGTAGSNCLFNNEADNFSPESRHLLQDFDVARANFENDPLFQDRAAGAFRLQAKSPCLPGNSPQDSLHIGALPGDIPVSSTDTEFLRDADFGDIDNDGLLDLVAVSDSVDFAMMNDGGGVFPAEHIVNIPNNGAEVSYAVELGDLDGDGDLDAVIANQTNDILAIYEEGVFQIDADTFASTASRNVKIADLNSDGFLDVVFAKEASNTIYWNDGNPESLAFTNSDDNVGASADTRDIGIGDLDGDGDLDLYFANHGQDEVLLNDGNGIFSSGAPSPTSQIADKATLGDIDLDGDLDVFIASVDGANTLLLNDGNAVFVEAELSSGFDLPLADADFVDYDLDGLLDILAVTPGSMVRFMNRGDLNFEIVTGETVQDGYVQADAGDIDNDGWPEAVLVRQTGLVFATSLEGRAPQRPAVHRITPLRAPAGSLVTATGNIFRPGRRNAKLNLNGNEIEGFMVNASQASFLLPEDIAEGSYDLDITDNDLTVARAELQIGSLTVPVNDWMVY